MYLFLLVFPLLLPTAESACINCGGADKTSAKRLKMPNKSVFTRLAGIELMEIFEITNQKNHEVCAQQCDAHAECAVFEFNLPNKLCVLASEYARLSEDLAKGAFETIVFVKVRGKFTKALPKDKETCLDKSEYEDYVKHEVDKWLNPSPKKSTLAHGSSPDPPTTVSEPAQTSSSTQSVSSPTTTTAGTTSGGTTTGTSSSISKGSGGETTTGIGSAVGSSVAATSTASGSTSKASTSESSTTSTRWAPTEAEKTTTSAAVPSVPVASATSASTAPRSDSSVPTTPTTTVSKRGEDGVKRSTDGTTVDDVKSTQQQGETSTTMVESEEPSSTESSPGMEQSSTTTAYVEEISTTAEPKEDDDSKSSEESGVQAEIPEKTKEVPGGRYRIKNAADGYNLRAKDKKDVEMSDKYDSSTYWDIDEREDWRGNKKIIIQSVYYSGRFLRADLGGVVNLAKVAEAWEEWTAADNGDRTWSFVSYKSTWLNMGKGGKVTHTGDSSKAGRFLLEPVM